MIIEVPDESHNVARDRVSLPLFVRAVQSLKRYVDSRLYTHLINVSLLFIWEMFEVWLLDRAVNTARVYFIMVSSMLGDITVDLPRHFDAVPSFSQFGIGRKHDRWFGLFIFFATFASIYTTAWVHTLPLFLACRPYWWSLFRISLWIGLSLSRTHVTVFFARNSCITASTM